MEPESRFIDVDGVSIHVLRWPGTGAPLLLLHGTGFLADLWRRVVDSLHEHYDVAALDVRGHGRSARPAGRYDFPTLAGDVAGLLDALGWRDVYLAGHSMGAALALIVAARRSELVRRVCAVEPVASTHFRRTAAPATPAGGGMAEAVRKRRAGFPSRAAAEARWRDRPAFARWDPQVLSDYVQYGLADQDDGSVTLRCPPAIEAQVYAAVTDFDATPYLRDVRCPVLIAQGERTNPLFATVFATAAALLADVERITIPGTSHFAPMEAPALVAEEIRAFDAAAR
ncbi:MAG: alpha/beta hydrolase [Chloroflexi bacterium]|nr:alpha/beta hydrolase [Chloroflexota bacterium]